MTDAQCPFTVKRSSQGPHIFQVPLLKMQISVILSFFSACVVASPMMRYSGACQGAGCSRNALVHDRYQPTAVENQASNAAQVLDEEMTDKMFIPDMSDEEMKAEVDEILLKELEASSEIRNRRHRNRENRQSASAAPSSQTMSDRGLRGEEATANFFKLAKNDCCECQCCYGCDGGCGAGFSCCDGFTACASRCHWEDSGCVWGTMETCCASDGVEFCNCCTNASRERTYKEKFDASGHKLEPRLSSP